MQRRRRAAGEDHGEADVEAEGQALAQLERELEQEQVTLPPILDGEDVDAQLAEMEVEVPEKMVVPLGAPASFQPLFSPEQLTALGALQMQAPQLYGGASRLRGPAEELVPARPAFLEEEEKKAPQVENGRGDGPGGAVLAAAAGDLPPAVLQVMQQLYEDNQKLRLEQDEMRRKVEASLAARAKEEYGTTRLRGRQLTWRLKGDTCMR